MSEVCRKDIDYVGTPSDPSVRGILIGSHAQDVFVNTALVSVVSDEISPHKPYSNPHNNATVTVGSPNVFVHGLAVFRKDDVASCGHIAMTGSGNVSVN